LAYNRSFTTNIYLFSLCIQIVINEDPEPEQEVNTLSQTLFKDVFPYIIQWFIIFVLIGVHIYITFMVEVPGCGKGYLGPGGKSDNGSYFNCTGGAAGYIDMIILGKNRIYKTPSCNNMYNCGEFDP